MTETTEQTIEWSYRVLGRTHAGGVTGTEVVPSTNPQDLEAAHERIMRIPGTTMAETVGPFPKRRETDV